VTLRVGADGHVGYRQAAVACGWRDHADGRAAESPSGSVVARSGARSPRARRHSSSCGRGLGVAPTLDTRAVKVFVSSLIVGFEAARDVAASGATALGHGVVRAEDFGASPNSPQSACLAGVRAADVVILILGARYGHVQASGLSATHEEYREARDTRPVIVFIEAAIDPDPQQAEFIREVQGWERGHFTAEFRDAPDLRDKVMRALHDYILATESAPLDEVELVDRATSFVPGARTFSGTGLTLVVAGGPRRVVLRPAEMESAELHGFLMAEALTGADAVLSPARGTDLSVRGDTVRLVQEHGVAGVALDEAGSLVVIQPAVEREVWSSGIASIIEEDVAARLTRAFRFCGRVLDHVDAAQRITHVAIVAALRGAGHMPWRTRDEQQRSPNAATMSMRSTDDAAVTLSPPVRRRAALLHDTQRLVEDFTVRLRREAKG
jgi:hypothetical protein